MPVDHRVKESVRSRALSGLAWSVSSLALATAFFASPAVAATADNSGIETVTVTAQYTEQNIQATPLAITALTTQDLAQRGITDLSQIGNTIPNLTLNKTPAAFGSGVQTYIRGVGQYDTAFAAEPGVGMYIDDVYYGTLFGTVFDMLDLSQVEVDRGPQGVLGGKNNIGGSIKMSTKKATGDGSGYIEATYGSYNEVNIRGAFDVSIIPDHLFLRLSGVSKQQDGYVNVIDFACAYPAQAGTLPVTSTNNDCKSGTQGGTNVRGGRLSLRAIITPTIEDNFTADILRDDSESQADTLLVADTNQPTIAVYHDGALIHVARASFYTPNSAGGVTGGPPFAPPSVCGGICDWNNAVNIPTYGIPWDERFIPHTNGQTPYNTTYATYTDQEGQAYTDGAMVHAWGMSNTLDWDILDNVHFKSITGYRFYNAANSNDSDVSPLSYQLTTTRPVNREFQQEERFTGTLFDSKLAWSGGLFYYNRSSDVTGGVVIDGALAPFLQFEQHDRYQSESKSAYLHGIYHISDDLEVFAGIRYTKESKTYFFDHSGLVAGYPGGGFFRDTVDPTLDCNLFAGHVPCDHSISPPLVAHTSRTNRPDYRAGLDYHVTDDAMAYFQYSTGYRTGGTNSRPFSPDQLDTYGPESLTSYEIGAKTDWFDHRLRANIALFMSEYENKITPLSAVDPLFPFLPYVKYVNLASEEDKGGELEITAVPIDNMLIEASYSILGQSQAPVPGAVPGYLDGCTSVAICGTVSPGTIKVGSHVILVPDTTAHIGAQYRFDLGDAGALTPRLDIQWQSTIWQGANNNPYTAIAARDTMDARLTWDAPTGGWQVALAVSNLTDLKYFYDVFDLSAFGQGSVEAQPAPGREWHIQLRKAF